MSRKADRAAIEARRARVATLLLARVSYRKMAEQLKCSIGTISKDVSVLLAEWAKEQKPEDRHKWLTLELAKLDSLEFAIATQTQAGNLGAVDRALRVMERRAKLLGLDAPSRVEVRDWRDDARQHGVDPDALVAELVAKVNGSADAGDDPV